MALTTGILIAKYSIKGHLWQTMTNADDAAVSAAWTQLKTTTAGYLADGTRLKGARLVNPATYDTQGNIVTLQSIITDVWNDPGSDVSFQTSGALGDPGACAMNVIRLASNVADAETFTIGTEVYEFTDDGALTDPTNIPVDISGGLTPTLVSPQIVASINGSNKQNLFAEAISVNEILIRKTSAGVDTTACSETMAGANNAWAATAFYGGIAFTPTLRRSEQSRVPNAAEVAMADMNFSFDFLVGNVTVRKRTTADGTETSFGGTVTVNGNRVTLHNTGTNDFSANDTIIISVTD